jgi:spermine oxidase
LRKFLKNKTIPDPSHIFCSRWGSNNFIGGAYSYTSKDTDDIRNWEKVLSQPVVKETANGDRNVLLFAGEAAHEQYFSTVHGAFLSGIQQAELILNFRRKNSKL